MNAHLALTTKYRRNVLTAAMLTRLGEIMDDLCEQWNCKWIEFSGEDNHIHLLFPYLPQMEIPKFVNNLKSVTSRRIRSEFADEVGQVYWKNVLWNESYFIASCGGVTVSVLRKYIENQDTPDE
jgi:putative transposase